MFLRLSTTDSRWMIPEPMESEVIRFVEFETIGLIV
jgi:hypothetical protein